MATIIAMSESRETLHLPEVVHGTDNRPQTIARSTGTVEVAVRVGSSCEARGGIAGTNDEKALPFEADPTDRGAGDTRPTSMLVAQHVGDRVRHLRARRREAPRRRLTCPIGSRLRRTRHERGIGVHADDELVHPDLERQGHPGQEIERDVLFALLEAPHR